MDKFILVRKNDKGMPEYLRELSGDDAYTDDLGHALIFEDEREALRERIDDEYVAVLTFDEEGGILGYESKHKGYLEVRNG